jgi:Abnormal spindle-like microcephaly-assoc'd, ASPM-SPD-2-Hydin
VNEHVNYRKLPSHRLKHVAKRVRGKGKPDLRFEGQIPRSGRKPLRLVRRHYRQPRFLLEHSTGQVRPDLWRDGIGHIHRMKIAAGIRLRVSGRPGVTSVVGVQWTQIGPAPLRIDKEQIYQGSGPDSGEVTDLVIDPGGSADQTIYIAANDGGIWKSTDAGSSWVPKTDFMPSLSMGAVALDPANSSIVYAGTGNLFDGGGIFTKGVGIYKSVDAGETWSILGENIFRNVGINRIVLPSSNILLVATNSGLFRSADGGRTFGANAPVFNDGLPILSGFISDLSLDSASPSTTVYAAVSGQGLFKSTDGGVTFPVNLFSNPGAPPSPFNFIAFAQSTQPDNQTMYASVQPYSPSSGLFKSTDGGTTWNFLADASNRAAENGGAQLAYDQTLGVDPQNANRVYLGFQELYVSTNGGANFSTPATSRNKIHWDHHCIVFSPGTHLGTPPSQLYVGTDGGIATSTDGGSSWSNLNNGIATNLFVGIDIGRGSAANNAFTFGGTQDTGTIEHRPSFPGTDWHLGVDGDGGPVVVDPSNPLRVYGSDDGDYMFTSNGGDNWTFPTAASTGLPPDGARPPNCMGTPRGVDPNSSAVVYVSQGNQLFQSIDTGATFTLMRSFPAAITSVATVSLDSNTLWVGLQDGTVQRTANALAGAGSNWSAFSAGLPVGRRAEALAIDPFNVSYVAVVYSGFSAINPINRTQHVYLTKNNGATWSDISGTDGSDPSQNLPDLPLHSIVIDRPALNGLFGISWTGSQLVAVGDLGDVFTSTDGIVWMEQASGTSNRLNAITWSGSQLVTVDNAGTILTSPDGVTWTAQASGTTDTLRGLTWSGSQFLAVDSSAAIVLTSVDGIAWISRTTGSLSRLLGVSWTGNQFVAVGYAGTILTSADTITWRIQASGTSSSLMCIIWSGSQLVAVGDFGTIITSPDGITWTVQISGTSNRLNAITWSGSQLVAVGDFGTIITSPEGIVWTDHSFGAPPPTIIVASDAGVMQTVDEGNAWQVLGVGLPTVDCKSLVLDSIVNPSLLRVGTYGRSVFEITTVAGPRVTVRANLAFGTVGVGSTATLSAQVFNVGSSSLLISSLVLVSGSADFHISGGQRIPVTIPPGSEVDYVFLFSPSTAGNMTAIFQMNTNDPANPTHTLYVSGIGI